MSFVGQTVAAAILLAVTYVLTALTARPAAVATDTPSDGLQDRLGIGFVAAAGAALLLTVPWLGTIEEADESLAFLAFAVVAGVLWLWMQRRKDVGSILVPGALILLAGSLALRSGTLGVHLDAAGGTLATYLIAAGLTLVCIAVAFEGPRADLVEDLALGALQVGVLAMTIALLVPLPGSGLGRVAVIVVPSLLLLVAARVIVRSRNVSPKVPAIAAAIAVCCIIGAATLDMSELIIDCHHGCPGIADQ